LVRVREGMVDDERVHLDGTAFVETVVCRSRQETHTAIQQKKKGNTL